MGEERFTKDEEHYLIERAQKGDHNAKKALIDSYKNMIRKMAIQYFEQKKDVEFAEIYEEGI